MLSAFQLLHFHDTSFTTSMVSQSNIPDDTNSRIISRICTFSPIFPTFAEFSILFQVSRNSGKVVSKSNLDVAAFGVPLCNREFQRLVVRVVDIDCLLAKLTRGIFLRQSNERVLDWCKHSRRNLKPSRPTTSVRPTQVQEFSL